MFYFSKIKEKVFWRWMPCIFSLKVKSDKLDFFFLHTIGYKAVLIVIADYSIFTCFALTLKRKTSYFIGQHLPFV